MGTHMFAADLASSSLADPVNRTWAGFGWGMGWRG